MIKGTDTIKQLIKNFAGWSTKRKIVVFSVDDYGNVRLDSASARKKINEAGYKARNRFDMYDSLENDLDLESLFEVLSSVKDGSGKNAVFSPFTVPCNINFEEMASQNFSEYIFELLPETFSKLSQIHPEAYSNTWKLWNEGIEAGLIKPQYHGREHFNLELFNSYIQQRNNELLFSLKNRSLTKIYNPDSNISFSASYAHPDYHSLQNLSEIASDGVDHFREIFKSVPIHFCAPAATDHPLIHKALNEKGIKFIDTARKKTIQVKPEKNIKKYFYTGRQNADGQTFLVRNVVFEPTDKSSKDEYHAMLQIKAAFRMNKPAIISSHRVNFSGNIDENNRKKGLDSLSRLLKSIVQTWPDVEFMSIEELDNCIVKNV